MASFEEAFKHIIIVEGVFSNHPNDAGKATKFGISSGAYQAYFNRRPSIEEMQRLSIDEARAIYKSLYWEEMKLGLFPQSLALVVFDQAVNRGTFGATKTLQEVLGVKVDGVIGRRTIDAIDVANERKLIWRFLVASMNAYSRIVEGNASQAVFLRGWFLRVSRLMEAFCVQF